MKVTLQEIFIAQANKHIYKQQDLFPLKINPDFLNTMATQLNLSYLESDSQEGNVCFADNSEVRPEFRTVFNKMDIIRYVSSFLTKVTFDLEVEVPIPKNAITFWDSAKGTNM